MIAELAGGQHGLVARAQLLDKGVTSEQVAYRLAAGRLHLLHRGVYAVGHTALDAHARALAAVLACGRGAVLSHRSAAVLWELLPARHGLIDVTRAGSRRRGPDGVRLHRVAELAPADLGRRHGIGVTAPARTLLDLAAVASPQELERAATEAQVRHLVHPERVLDCAAGRRGVRALRDALMKEPALTRSEAERRLLALIARAELPRPRPNVRIGRHEVDMLWPDSKLVVEVDGYAYHSSRSAFERDRLRDAELQAAGLRVMRVTWRQIAERPEALVVRLARALTGGGDVRAGA